jgi:GNAT superfamily N-acetyltransferase
LESSHPKQVERLSLRQIIPADGQALSELYQASPDSGQIQIAPLYYVDAYRALLDSRPSVVGVVAELPETGQLVGAGFVHFGQSQFEGALRPFAVLSGVVVHPDFRRRGIASQIAGWRVDCARQRLGEEGIIVTAIQKQNTGSFAVAGTWSQQFVGRLSIGAVRMRQKPPDAVNGLTIRPAESSDLEAIAAGLNDFYQEYNFYELQSAETLADWLSRSPFDTPIRHYFVAENATGKIVAGVGVTEQYRTMEMQVQHIPLAMQWLNKIVRFVPADGRLKQITLRKVWFAAGQKKAAQYLAEFVRWQWREKASTLTFTFDPRSPAADVLAIPFWLPKGQLVLAVNGPVMMQESRPIHPI